MQLRQYTEADAEGTLTVFLRAIRETAAGDYSPDQVSAWAAQHGDLATWTTSRQAADTRVAIIDGRVVGFTDLDDDGHVDMLFVDPDFGRRGIATSMLAATIALARRRGIAALTTYASLTARPLFERHGFVIIEQRHFLVRNVELTNFEMRRDLRAP